MADWTTTLFEWVRTRWPRSAPPPERATSICPTEQSTPHVPREYLALYAYLEHRYASVVVLTFEQIEALLGFALPTPARTGREWWTTTVETQHHSVAWTEAGRTAAPSLAAEIVTFERRQA
jgi:hypothetical protein